MYYRNKKKYEVYLETIIEAEKLSVETLEELIDYHSGYESGANSAMDEKLEVYLAERAHKLNQTFEWTPENKDRLLCLNDKLIECFEKLKVEATAILDSLQRRVDAQDVFLHDFEIEAKVTPYFYEPDENGVPKYEIENGIERVLMDNWEDWHLSFSANNQEDLNSVLYLNREQNWNTDHWFCGQFDEHFISQGIHDLYDHTKGWSFPDILRINHLWAELKIRHQHFIDV